MNRDLSVKVVLVTGASSGIGRSLAIAAGAAGCVLANCLTENPDTRVALIEAGPDRNSCKAIVRLPLAIVTFMAPALAFVDGPRFVQWFQSEVEHGLTVER